MPDDFERMWSDLAPLGRSSASGGYFRQPFTSVDDELRSWFGEQAARRGLVVEADAFGNLVAWWHPVRPASGRGVLTGSHLDSVPDGGAYDGPLGVVSALAALDLLRSRGFVPSRSIGVSVFAEEEGSRFGLACLGSRLATGALSWAAARGLRDRDGVFLADALASCAGVDRPAAAPAAGRAAGAGSEAAAPSLAERVECFVELHVEQGRDLVDRGAAVGVASEIWPHGRYRFDFTGSANHAGTTRMEDREDPMLSYAMTALAANKQARAAGQRATFGRLEVAPNGTNAIPSRVTAWLDARASTDAALGDLVEAITRQASDRAGRDGTSLEVTAESASGAVVFDPGLAARVAADHEGGDWPVIPTMAGHDAGILSAAGIPTAMLFVRNPSGVSHSPAEHAEIADCLVGVSALADTLERLAR
jgi:N-carbamoyl-L-amino-acid hydrolase